MLRKLASGALLLIVLAVVLATSLVPSPASAATTLDRADVSWTTLPGDLVQFQLRFRNTTPDPSGPISGDIYSQPFGVFLPNAGLIGHFDIPPLAPDSFFDVFYEVQRSELPANPDQMTPQPARAPGGAGVETNSCPPDDHWDGNVDIIWNDPVSGVVQVNKHFGTLQVAPGGGNSYLHVISGCDAAPITWSLSPLCPGFSATLVNEDFTPAPPLLPSFWTGWLCVTADASVANGTECCFDLTILCGGMVGVIDMCVTACDPGIKAPDPIAGQVTWGPIHPDGQGDDVVTFQMRFSNPDPNLFSRAATGNMESQPFGAFLGTFGPIGAFNVPQLAPDSFFDIVIDISLNNLPPEPAKILPGGGPGASTIRVETNPNNCPPDDHWDGNVDVHWGTDKTQTEVNYHFGELLVCPGAGNSYIHVVTGCTDPLGSTWSINNPCPGFSATLVNEDFTPAPAVVPDSWTGWLCVTADASVAVGDSCCLSLVLTCGPDAATIDVCVFACDWSPKAPNPVLASTDWSTNPATLATTFHLRWTNPDPNLASRAVTGTMASQEFGVFAPDFGPIGQFNVPPLAPDSFFDVFFEVQLPSLPPEPAKILPGGGPGASTIRVETNPSGCPPDTSWDGNVDIQWTSDKEPGQVNYHFGDLLVCPGAGNSYIHVRPIECGPDVTWFVKDLCPGFDATLVNEDFTPAPASLPFGWSGWICVSAVAGTPIGQTCCLKVNFLCNGQPAEIQVCATACDWSPKAPDPVAGRVTWGPIHPNGQGDDVVTFQMRFSNPDPNLFSRAATGNMESQPFGAFLGTFGPIGAFNVPPLAPDSFFDVFFDVALADLPPEPAKILPGGGPGASTIRVETNPNNCPPDDHWDGNVDVHWGTDKTQTEVNYHFGELLVCPGAGNSYIHVITGCTDPLGSSWSINGLCPGFSATLVNEDFTPAPPVVPDSWTGWLCVTADAFVATGDSCCFTLDLTCGTDAATIDVCAFACNWAPKAPNPVLTVSDWTTNPATLMVQFHLHWTNPDPNLASRAVTGTMSSQEFGVFLPDFGPIGQFNVPPLAPDSFFDVFFEVPLPSLPPSAQEILPGGGTPARGPSTETSPCPPDDHWDGNVDIQWTSDKEPGQVNYHFGTLLVAPGGGNSYIHLKPIICGPGATWSVNSLCPGFNATLVNEDFTPAPALLPSGWSGFICISAIAGLPAGITCCFTVDFICDGQPAQIVMCATTCDFGKTGVPGVTGSLALALHAIPNPSFGTTTVHYTIPRAGSATIEVFDAGGKRVRTLLTGRVEAGPGQVVWNGLGEHGRALSSGAYFLRLTFEGDVVNRRVVLVR